MKRLSKSWLLACLFLLWAGVAQAQPKGPDKEGFESVSLPANMNPEGEGIAAVPLVATAYGFIWLAVLVFVGSVAYRARRLEGQIAELQAQVEARSQRPSAG